jgi:hypothetical protein
VNDKPLDLKHLVEVPQGQALAYDTLVRVLENMKQTNTHFVIVFCYDENAHPVARFSNIADMNVQLGLVERTKSLMLAEEL